MSNNINLDDFYKLNEGHIVSNDGLSECFNYFNLVINDIENSSYSKEQRIDYIKLCINFDNYFATLASILKFATETEGVENSNLGLILKNIEKDLLYLQKNYTIVEKKDKKYL